MRFQKRKFLTTSFSKKEILFLQNFIKENFGLQYFLKGILLKRKLENYDILHKSKGCCKNNKQLVVL